MTAPAPSAAHLHAANDNLAGSPRPAPMDPAEQAAFDQARAILAGRPCLMDQIALAEIVRGDPTVGDLETLRELRAGRL